MNTLAIETATRVCATAVIVDGIVRAEHSVDSPNVHSEKLLTLIDASLNGAAIERTAIDLISVSIGPGSFTGLRIGLSAAKGLAFALDIPLIAVSTLSALALRAGLSGAVEAGTIILPLIDARRDEVYAAGFRWESSGVCEVFAPAALTIAELMQKIKGESAVLLTGDGAGKFVRALGGDGPDQDGNIRLLEADLRSCSATSVGLLGEKEYVRGVRFEIELLEPFYLKEFHSPSFREQASVHS